MKISEIQIQQFGVWKNVTLPVKNGGMNVLYGPNEAGKSTLLRFVRGLLYGYPATDGNSSDTPTHCDGSLAVTVNDERFRIRRTSKQGTRGQLSITGKNDARSAELILSELLAGTDENIFENVFAIGLTELQELATLDHKRVSEKLYSLTLGPEGKTLLGVSDLLQKERSRFVSSPNSKSDYAKLTRRASELTQKIGQADQHLSGAAHLRQKTRGLHQQIEELNKRQLEIDSEQRQRTFLQQIWKPWNRVRELESQLSKMPALKSFPKNGLSLYHDTERDLKTLTRQQSDSRSQRDGFRKRLNDSKRNTEIGRNASAIASFVEQRDWLGEILNSVRTLERESTTARQSLDRTLSAMPRGWSLERLESVDTSPQAHHQIMILARGYQSALANRRRFRKRYDKLSNLCRQQTGKLKDQAQTFGGMSVDDASRRATQQLNKLTELEQLHRREEDLREKSNRLKQQTQFGQGNWEIPPWMVAMLWLFGLAGVGFLIAGIYAGITVGWIAGGAYALLAATCGMLNWAMNAHYERSSQTFVEQLADEISQTETQLRKTEETADRIAGRDLTDHSRLLIRIPQKSQAPVLRISRNDAPYAADSIDERYRVGQTWNGPTPKIWDAPQFQTVRTKLETRQAELDDFSALHKRLQTNRQRLSGWRQRMQSLQQNVSVKRQQWCDFLRKLGLAETVRINEAFEIWQKVVEANDQRRLWKIKSDELQSRQRIVHSFGQRIEKLGKRIKGWDFDYSKPLDVLSAWEAELADYRKQRKNVVDWKKQYRNLQKTEKSILPQLRKLKKQRSTLFDQAGVDNKAHFLERVGQLEQSQQLRTRLAEAESELSSAIKQHPGLAIVEDDLLAFTTETHTEQCELLDMEKEENQSQLKKLHEKLGSVKQGLSEVEGNQHSTLLRYERERLYDQLQEIEEQWCAVQLADQSLSNMRSRFERDNQPETLRNASAYLNQLTTGKYKNVWAPLGQHHLTVEDEQGHQRRIEELSNGTREQLFLAVRLALVDEFDQQQVELPMVLDDITVNFDQTRTEAAIDALIDRAAKGQQFLFFTCHLHLARLFEERGIEPIWLPSRHSDVEERRVG